MLAIVITRSTPWAIFIGDIADDWTDRPTTMITNAVNLRHYGTGNGVGVARNLKRFDTLKVDPFGDVVLPTDNVGIVIPADEEWRAKITEINSVL